MSFFSLSQVVVFRLPATFHSQATDGGCEQNTFSQCMLCQHIALHSFLVPLAQGHLDCVPKTRLRLLRSVSRHAQYTQHSVLYISHCHWSPKVDHIQNPPALIHQNLEVTVSRIQNLAQVVSPRGSSTTGPFLNRRLRILPKKVFDIRPVFFTQQPVIVVFYSRFH